MSNQLKGMYLMASLLLACGATHDVGEQLRGQLQDDAGEQGDSGSGGPSSQADSGLTGSCINSGDCDPFTQVCDNGVCRTGCGHNYPGASCGQGEICYDYVCRPASCSAQNPCPQNYGCSNGTCVPTGQTCNAQSPCLPDQVCVQGVCHLWCGPNYPNLICPSGQQCQPNDICS